MTGCGTALSAPSRWIEYSDIPEVALTRRSIEAGPAAATWPTCCPGCGVWARMLASQWPFFRLGTEIWTGCAKPLTAIGSQSLKLKNAEFARSRLAPSPHSASLVLSHDFGSKVHDRADHCILLTSVVADPSAVGGPVATPIDAPYSNP